jgi:Glycosyltransferase family 28 C-terminal domain
MPKKTIIVAPLNWGLGHATRCIPLIKELEKQGATVILASDGAALDLLHREFPHLESHALPPYNIRYPFRSMVLSMALQSPKLLRGVVGEYFWLRRFLKTRHVDAVVSDNRFGFFSKKIKSIFMTHQIQILVDNRFLQKIANWLNHFFIRRFDACWVPDFEDSDKNLSGRLGHFEGNSVSQKTKTSLSLRAQRSNLLNESSQFSIKRQFLKLKDGFAALAMTVFVDDLEIKYLGALSRLQNHADSEFYPPSVKKYKIAFILSGPEPQRTYFETKIWDEIQKNNAHLNADNAQILLVRGTKTPLVRRLDGLFTENMGTKRWHNVHVYDVLTSEDLNPKMLESEVIICRSGYSSVMDLWALQQPAVLIPTDGQTEQEYLADKLRTENRFFSQRQTDFDLEIALKTYPNYRGFHDFPLKNETLTEIVREFLIL